MNGAYFSPRHFINTFLTFCKLDMKNVPMALSEYIEFQDHTIRSLAKKVNVDPNDVHGWMSGDKPMDHFSIKRLSQSNVGIDVLFYIINFELE